MGRFTNHQAMFTWRNIKTVICRYNKILKELYTSETTLAQKIVLTPLNDEFVLEIRYSTPIMQEFECLKSKVILDLASINHTDN